MTFFGIIFIAVVLCMYQFYIDIRNLIIGHSELMAATKETHRIQGDILKSLQQLAQETERHLQLFDKRLEKVENA